MRRVVAVLAAVALVAGACSDDPQDAATTTTTTTTVPGAPTTTVPEEVTMGGTLFVDLMVEGDTLDPLQITPMFSLGWVAIADDTVLAGAYRADGLTGRFVPYLIGTDPTTRNGGFILNDDGTLTVRYDVNPEAVWSDGVPVTGHDFAFTYSSLVEVVARFEVVDKIREVIADADGQDVGVEQIIESTGADRDLAEDVLGGAYRLQDACGTERPLELVDGVSKVFIDLIVPGSVTATDTSVEFTVKSPEAYNEELFRYIHPRHAVEGTDLALDWLDSLWPTAGPFVVEEFDRDGPTLTMVRNENYWQTDPETGDRLPRLDRVVVGRHPALRAALPESRTIAYEDADEQEREVVLDLREFDRLVGLCGRSYSQAFSDIGVADETAFEAAAEVWDAEVEQARRQLIADGVLVEHDGLDGNDIAWYQEVGVEVTVVGATTWEQIGFHFGDNRLLANPDSLVEHVEFRRAIAHAIDRDRIAREVPVFPTEPINGIIEVFSPSIDSPAAEAFAYDPDVARGELAGLCVRLERDCETDPPTVVLTAPSDDRRQRTAVLVAAMLEEVGIRVTVVDAGSVAGMLFSCDGFEMALWALRSATSLAQFIPIYEVLDPEAPPLNPETHAVNFYAWGTDAFDGVEDLAFTPDCDESELFVQGPSSVRNEFTARYAELVDRVAFTLDVPDRLQVVREMETIIGEQVPLIPLYVRPYGFVVNDDIIGGAGKMVGAVSLFWDLEHWYLRQPQPGT